MTQPLTTGDKPKRSLLSRVNPIVTLDILGLSAVTTAFGMWDFPVGVGVGGLAILVLSWRLENR